MTREEVKAMLPVLQAFAEGKTIESRCVKGDTSLWYDDEDPTFNEDYKYRIKPEPKYRPFKDAEECWAEMQKHQPFGWVKCKDDSIPGKFMYIISVRSNEVAISSALDISYSELIKYYTFIDGTPVGVKIEEQLCLDFMLYLPYLFYI